MKKRIYISVVVLFLSFQLVGQSNIRFNNFWDNLYTINPASINDSYYGELLMGSRKSWLTFPGAPWTVEYVAGTIYLENFYTQLGLKVMSDKIGYTFTTDMAFSYAYAVHLNHEWQLNLGIAPKIQLYNYDLSQIRLTSGDYTTDNIPYEQIMKLADIENNTNLNLDMGFELSNYAWRIGMSSQNFLTIFKNLKINNLHPFTNIAYAMYKTNGNTFVNWGGGICGIQTGNVYQAELNASAFFKKTTQQNAFQIGAFYRTWNEMGVLLGIHTEKFRIYYSYDFNVSEIYRNVLGSHEIMLAYKLNRTYKCRNCWY